MIGQDRSFSATIGPFGILNYTTTQGIKLDEFSFDWGLSSDAGGGLMGATQLFASTDASTFFAVGPEFTEQTLGNNITPDFTGLINRSVNLANLGVLNGGDTLAFRDNSGASTGDKGHYLDNLVLTGVLIPEPATMGLLGLGGLVLLRRRRSV